LLSILGKPHSRQAALAGLPALYGMPHPFGFGSLPVRAEDGPKFSGGPENSL
jgi:hypothetical protein